ncbi:alpha/beta hydrolase [Flavisphingomonas formosensis]|uniref:alpha/beta hydrolase n=1 Tax=Flavisphingomonas formosensis TaxID=861534 RepID=UPI0012F9973F|nr:alpha/beta fold hydrolase [Sphingomonas formosensis]
MHNDYPDSGRNSVRPALREQLRIDVTEAAALGCAAHIAVELIVPGDAVPRFLFVCVPGGGMNSRYFDLPTPPGETEVSFARAMLAEGHAVAMIDPLGVGGSSVPEDGFALHPDRMAESHAVATRQILGGLRAGTLIEGYPAAPELRSIGVGHSMGALLTIVQQAAEPMHDALALFGFHTGGLPAQLSEGDFGLDPVDTRTRLVELTRKRFPDAFIALEPPPSSRPVSAAVAIDRVYLTPSYMAMLPGMIAADAAAIDVPVLIALGDGDLHREPHRTPAAYAGSPDITLLVLPDTKHNHFIYPSRTRFFDRVARWAEAL